MRCNLFVLVLSCAAFGCTLNHGPRPEDLPLAAASKGRPVEIQLHSLAGAPRATWSGELLEVRDSSLVLLLDTVVVAHFDAIRRVRVEGVMPALSGTEYQDYRRRRPGAYLRHVSRFPYGAPAEAMQQILRERGQAAPRSEAADTAHSVANAVSATPDASDLIASPVLLPAAGAAPPTTDAVVPTADAMRFMTDARA